MSRGRPVKHPAETVSRTNIYLKPLVRALIAQVKEIGVRDPLSAVHLSVSAICNDALETFITEVLRRYWAEKDKKEGREA